MGHFVAVGSVVMARIGGSVAGFGSAAIVPGDGAGMEGSKSAGDDWVRAIMVNPTASGAKSAQFIWAVGNGHGKCSARTADRGETRCGRYVSRAVQRRVRTAREWKGDALRANAGHLFGIARGGRRESRRPTDERRTNTVCAAGNVGEMVWCVTIEHQPMVQVLVRSRLATIIEPESGGSVDDGGATAGHRLLGPVSLVGSTASVGTFERTRGMHHPRTSTTGRARKWVVQIASSIEAGLCDQRRVLSTSGRVVGEPVTSPNTTDDWAVGKSRGSDTRATNNIG